MIFCTKVVYPRALGRRDRPGRAMRLSLGLLQRITTTGCPDVDLLSLVHRLKAFAISFFAAASALAVLFVGTSSRCEPAAYCSPGTA